MSSFFETGDIVTTPAAKKILNNEKDNHISLLIRRHSTCDFGNLTQDEIQQNHLALNEGEQVISKYQVAGQDIYVITEHDRSYTTIMLFQEYL